MNITDNRPAALKLAPHTFGGKTFKCSWYVYCHLLFTQWMLLILAPGKGHYIHVMQGCYHEGYEPSAGTHDKDAVLDFRILDARGAPVDWWWQQKFFRLCGWAAWYRHTGIWAAPAQMHIHAISLGAFLLGSPVGSLIASQVAAYRRHYDGLARSVTKPDSSWFPPDINGTVFNLTTWETPMDALKDTCTRLGLSYVEGGRTLFRAAVQNTTLVVRKTRLWNALALAPKK